MTAFIKSLKKNDNKTELEINLNRLFYILMLSVMFTVLIYIIYVTDTISIMFKNQGKSDNDVTKESYMTVSSAFVLCGTFVFTSFILHNIIPYWFSDSSNPIQCTKLCSDAHDADFAIMVDQLQRHNNPRGY
jgi:hypothetical protein